jgi:hypothetical protein
MSSQGLVTETALRIAVSAFSRRQVDNALSLIARGAVTEAAGLPGVFKVTASSHDGWYQTDLHGCNCPAGRKAQPCKHRCAVVLLTTYANAA